jgi:GNAT superfamily N-acetyltransferase
MDFELQEENDDSQVPAAIRKGIASADPPDVGQRDWLPLALSLRNADREIVGGVYGATMWSWLMIDGLWVDETLRGRGFGRQLLLRSESIATARGCRGSWLGTFDFQARAFYERHGYTVIAAIPGFPPGHTHYTLRKDLVPVPSLATSS